MKENYGACCASNYQIDYQIQCQTTITLSDGKKCRPDIVIWAYINNEWKAVVLELKSYENTYLPAKCVKQTCRYRNNLKEFNGYSGDCVGAIICCRDTTKMSDAFQQYASASDVEIRRFEPDPNTPNYRQYIKNIMGTVMSMLTKTEEL